MLTAANILAKIQETSDKGILSVDLVRLNHPRSPIYAWADYTLPAIVLLIPVVLLFYLIDWKLALAGSICWLVLLAWPVRSWGSSRRRKRVLHYAFFSEQNWTDLWSAGALTMRLSNAPETYCSSPNGSWVDFVKAHVLTSEKVVVLNASHLETIPKGSLKSIVAAAAPGGALVVVPGTVPAFSQPWIHELQPYAKECDEVWYFFDDPRTTGLVHEGFALVRQGAIVKAVVSDETHYSRDNP